MRKALPLFSANLLYFLTMLLVILLGSLIQTWNLSWGLLITEFVLIALPAVLFLRQRHIPLKRGLRLNPISPLTAVLCVLLGFSTFLFSVIIEAVMAQLTGMASVPVPESSLPKGLVESVVYFIALAAAAPICEEILFRGVIQGAYETKRSVKFAIFITAVMFAFYHMRLSGLPGLLPVAFILSYVAWRTQSIIATMLIHFGMNATSGANTLIYTVTQKGLPFLSLWAALAGLVATVIILLVIRRLHPVPTLKEKELAGDEVLTEILPEPHPSWLGTYWPLIGAGLIYLAVTGSILFTALNPALMASAKPAFSNVTVTYPTHSEYQITNRAGDVVGSAICNLTPKSEQITLECSASMKAYEIHIGSSYFKDNDHTTTWSFAWDAHMQRLLSYEVARKNTDGTTFDALMKDGFLVTTDGETSAQVQLPEDVLMPMEWAWRGSNLLPTPTSTYKTPFAYLNQWDESQKKGVPVVQDQVLRLYNQETLTLPAGTFPAWKDTLGGQTAWYKPSDPYGPRPVKLDDGMVFYSLLK